MQKFIKCVDGKYIKTADINALYIQGLGNDIVVYASIARSHSFELKKFPITDLYSAKDAAQDWIDKFAEQLNSDTPAKTSDIDTIKYNLNKCDDKLTEICDKADYLYVKIVDKVDSDTRDLLLDIIKQVYSVHNEFAKQFEYLCGAEVVFRANSEV